MVGTSCSNSSLSGRVNHQSDNLFTRPLANNNSLFDHDDGSIGAYNFSTDQERWEHLNRIITAGLVVMDATCRLISEQAESEMRFDANDDSSPPQ